MPLQLVFTASGPTADDPAWNPPPPTGTNPYPGTYDLTATITLGPATHSPGDHPRYYKRSVTAFSETFSIRSATGRVDGVMQLVPGADAILNCYVRGGGWVTVPLRYTATIAPTGGGLFQDVGLSSFNMYYHEDPRIETVNWTLASDLAAPRALLTEPSQCKSGGWQSYDGRFTNQGDCIAFVQNGH